MAHLGDAHVALAGKHGGLHRAQPLAQQQEDALAHPPAPSNNAPFTQHIVTMTRLMSQGCEPEAVRPHRRAHASCHYIDC
jgi:hypothetical protein